MSRLRSALVVVTFFLPLVVMPGIEHPFSTPKFVLLGAVVGCGALLVGGCGLLRWPTLPQAFQVAFAVWLAALGASAAFGVFASLPGLLLPIVAAGWFLLLLLVRPRGEQLALVLVLSASIVALMGVLQSVGADPFALSGWRAVGGSDPRMRVFATLGNPNFVAAFLVAILPLTATLRDVFAERRALFSVLLGLQALAIFATGSRAPVLALAAILVWLAALRHCAAWRELVMVAVVVAVLALTFAPARHLTTTMRGRYYIWEVAAAHLGEHPLLGSGPGAFRAKYTEWETERWRSRHASEAEREFVGLQEHAHNDYLEIGLEHGLMGLAGWLALLGTFLGFACRRAQGVGGELAAAASAAVLALAAVALVDFPLHRPTELFVFWTLMAIAYLTAPRDEPATQT